MHAWTLHARELGDLEATQWGWTVGSHGKAAVAATPLMHGSEKSDWPVLCAGQCTDQEGRSPSGARTRGAISQSGGNGEPKTDTKLETAAPAKGMSRNPISRKTKSTS